MKYVVAFLVFLAACSSAIPISEVPVKHTNKCSADKPMPYWIDEEFNSDERTVVLHALNVWSQGTGYRLHWIEVDSPLSLHFVKLTDAKKIEEIDRHSGARVLGIFVGTDYSIHFMTERFKSVELFDVVAIHEIGHALGLLHNDRNVYTYMHASVDSIPRELWSNTILPTADYDAYWNLDDCKEVKVIQQPYVAVLDSL